MSGAMKPCPFCGSMDIYWAGDVLDYDEPALYTYSFRCHDCLAQGPSDEKLSTAKKSWNRRAKTPSLKKRKKK
jgi:Lar family restriction alleviation protein